MKLMSKKSIETYNYESIEEAQEHIIEMENNGWRILDKYTTTMFSFIKEND